MIVVSLFFTSAGPEVAGKLLAYESVRDKSNARSLNDRFPLDRSVLFAVMCANLKTGVSAS